MNDIFRKSTNFLTSCKNNGTCSTIKTYYRNLFLNRKKLREEMKSLESKVEMIINNQGKLAEEINMNLPNYNNSHIIREDAKEKPLFLIGSGPSLVDCDISSLKNCYTISFNRSYIAFKDWGFYPTYFAGLDHVVNNDNKDEYKKLIRESSIKRFFFTMDEMSKEHLISPKTSLVEIAKTAEICPNIDFNRKLQVANSGLFGLQLALGILGFKEIYLLGCDANYTDDVKGIDVVDGVYVSQKNKDVNHFRLDYYGKGTTYNRPNNPRYHLPAWKYFYDKYIKNNNFGYNVFNCSKTGKLDFFPFKDFEDIKKEIGEYEY